MFEPPLGFRKAFRVSGDRRDWLLHQFKDIQSHVLPGVLIVPSMVATIALLQIEGHFVYTTA